MLVLVLMGSLASSARAELLGTHPHRDGAVQLMTDLCRDADPSAGQRARQNRAGQDRLGCWGMDRAGNPVVTWSDGSELWLDGNQLKLAPPEAARDFARPAWCPDARFPHERLVCSDAELAGRDLRLASLWRPYRRTLSPAAEARHKSDYFRRLKACGADKTCIVDEQEKQMRLYRELPPAGG